MNDRGIIPYYLLSPLSKITNPGNTSQFEIVKNHNSKRVNDFLIHNTIPITVHNNLSLFGDSNKKFGMKGELLKMITNKNYNVDLASLSDTKFLYNFAKEMNFDVKGLGRKSTRVRTHINIFKSPGLMVSATGVSNTKIYHLILMNFVID